MKYLLLLLPLLLVACSAICPDCDEEEVGMCPSLRLVPEGILATIPYADGEEVSFYAPQVDDTLLVEVNRLDREPMSDGFCDELIDAKIVNEIRGFPFRLGVMSDLSPTDGLWFNIQLPVLGGLENRDYFVQFSQGQPLLPRPPDTIREIGDTTLAGVTYRQVFIYTVAEPANEDDVSRFYYSRLTGFVRVDRVSGPALTRVE